MTALQQWLAVYSVCFVIMFCVGLNESRGWLWGRTAGDQTTHAYRGTPGFKALLLALAVAIACPIMLPIWIWFWYLDRL